jgi:hypothetical protein
MAQAAANDTLAQQAQATNSVARGRAALEYDGSEASQERRMIIALLASIGTLLGWIVGAFRGQYIFPSSGDSLIVEGNWYDALVWTITTQGWALAGAGLGALAGVLIASIALLTLDRIYKEGHHKA